jgi:hypothetical protein
VAGGRKGILSQALGLRGLRRNPAVERPPHVPLPLRRALRPARFGIGPRNLTTLCTREDREHHLLLGHLDDYESYNPEVEEFIKTYNRRSNQQIRNDAAWQSAQARKPKHLDEMSQLEKGDFNKMLDGKFPPDPALVAKAAKARGKA